MPSWSLNSAKYSCLNSLNTFFSLLILLMDKIKTSPLLMAAQNLVLIWDNAIQFSDYQMKYKTLSQIKESCVFRAVKPYFVWIENRGLYKQVGFIYSCLKICSQYMTTDFYSWFITTRDTLSSFATDLALWTRIMAAPVTKEKAVSKELQGNLGKQVLHYSYGLV